MIDRFSQFKPKVIFSIDLTRYNGKTLDILKPLSKIIEKLPSLTHVIITGHTSLDRKPTNLLTSLPPGVKCSSWQSFISTGSDAPKQINFWRGPFQHPLVVVFSSGTTGAPKAIIHGAGNILIARKLVARIHLNLDHRDVCCQFTT